MKTIDDTRRFVPVAEYQRITGLSYKTIMHMIKTSQLRHIKTEGGHYRIDTQHNSIETTILLDKLNEMQKQVTALCKQLNTAI